MLKGNVKFPHSMWIGIDAQLIKPLVENCKRLATDPRHCIIAWASIIMAESGGKLKNCYKFNCMWYWVSRFRYTSYEVQIIDWIGSYNKYWYKAKWQISFILLSENTAKVGIAYQRKALKVLLAWLGHASKTWNLLSKNSNYVYSILIALFTVIFIVLLVWLIHESICTYRMNKRIEEDLLFLVLIGRKEHDKKQEKKKEQGIIII